jgi:ribosomal protein L37AE/L43A
MSLDALIAARRLILANKTAKATGDQCGCGALANWRCAAGVWRCTTCEKHRLAAEERLPPGIRLED